MTIRELVILGIHTNHFFEVGSYQKEYIINELGYTEEIANKFMNNVIDPETHMEIHNKNVVNLRELLEQTHKGRTYKTHPNALKE